LFHQYFQYGYWKVRVIRKHKLPASIRHIVPAAFVLSLVLLPLAALVWPHVWLVWLSLVGAYLACSIAAAFTAGRRYGWDVFLLMPFVFACYHFGYGIGFMVGIRDWILTRDPRALSREITRTT
jgi:hypothetical protein